MPTGAHDVLSFSNARSEKDLKIKTIETNVMKENLLIFTCSWLMLCRNVSSHDLNLVSLFCWHLDGDGSSKPDCVVQDDIVGGVVVLPKTHKYVGEFSSQTLFSARSGHQRNYLLFPFSY